MISFFYIHISDSFGFLLVRYLNINLERMNNSVMLNTPHVPSLLFILLIFIHQELYMFNSLILCGNHRITYVVMNLPVR